MTFKYKGRMIEQTLMSCGDYVYKCRGMLAYSIHDLESLIDPTYLTQFKDKKKKKRKTKK